MNDTQQLEAAIIAVQQEDLDKGKTASAIFLAISEIRNNSAQDDIEGEPCSIGEAIMIFTTAVFDATGIELSIPTTYNRRRMGEWLFKSGNKALVPGVAYSRHVICMTKGDTWKDLKKNPDAYRQVRSGNRGGCDVRDAEPSKAISHIKGCATSMKRMVARTQSDAEMYDELDDFAAADTARRCALLYDKLWPQVREANALYASLFKRP